MTMTIRSRFLCVLVPVLLLVILLVVHVTVITRPISFFRWVPLSTDSKAYSELASQLSDSNPLKEEALKHAYISKPIVGGEAELLKIQMSQVINAVRSKYLWRPMVVRSIGIDSANSIVVEICPVFGSPRSLFVRTNDTGRISISEFGQ